MSRIKSVRENLIGTEDADDLMLELMDVLGGTVTPVPDVGNFYIFVYNPKTPGIRYDQNPLVAVTDIFQWGFRGINFHWGETRQYTWNEIVGQLYQVSDDELDDLDAIPFSKILINN
tara:strand:- start:85 stop:435 length:351 start_codon:yes stop_codon:yes gene_type:complete